MYFSKITVLISCFLFLITSCSSNETKTNKHIQTESITVKSKDSKESEIGLNKFFSAETIHQITKLNTEFKSLKNASGWIENLFEASDLAKKLTNEIATSNTAYLAEKRQKFEYSQLTNEILKELNLYASELQPISALEGPEASSIDFFVDFQKYSNFTSRTKNNDDDDFLKLLLKVYGEKSFMGFLNYTDEWILREDQELIYFGYGNNKLLGVFQQIKDFESTYPNSFKKEIGQMKEAIYADLLKVWKNDWACFYQKEPVLEELYEINKLDNLSLSFKKKLSKYIERIEKQPWTFFGNDPEERQSYDVGDQ